jgi:hypothetical protein
VKVIVHLLNKNSGIVSLLSSLIQDGILLVTVKLFDYFIDYVGVFMTSSDVHDGVVACAKVVVC